MNEQPLPKEKSGGHNNNGPPPSSATAALLSKQKSTHSGAPPASSYVPNSYDWHSQPPAQYTVNRSEDEIELSSQMGQLTTALGGSSMSRNRAGYERPELLHVGSIKFLDENFSNAPLGSLAEQNMPLLMGRSVNEESEEEELRVVGLGGGAAGGENPKKRSEEADKRRADQEDGSSKNSPSSPSARKPDPYYLIYAFMGCIFFAAAGILRKYQG